MTATLQAVRKIMTSNGQAALDRIREIARQRAAIEARYKAALAEAKKLQTECESSWRAFLQSPCSIDLRQLAALRSQSDTTVEIFAHVYRRGAWVDEEFLRTTNTKELRKNLLTVAKHHLAMAQQQFAEALAHARAKFSEDFDAEAIEASPKVREVKSKVEKFERLVASIEQSADALLWQHAAQILE